MDTFKSNLQAKELQEQRQRLEMEQIRLQIEQLIHLPDDNRRTKRLAIVAIIVAAIPLLIELIKFLSGVKS